jgi:hypothetical protein
MVLMMWSTALIINCRLINKPKSTQHSMIDTIEQHLGDKQK